MNGAHMSCLNIALVFEQRSFYLQPGYSEEQCAALTHDGEIDAVRTTLHPTSDMVQVEMTTERHTILRGL
jgi:hypothetical protein